MNNWIKSPTITLGVPCLATFCLVYIAASRPSAEPTRATEASGYAETTTPARTGDALSTAVAGTADHAPIATKSAPDQSEPELASNAPTLRELALNPTSESIPRLVALAQNDGDTRNRLDALNGLRRAALQGIDASVIIPTLQAAAQSGDPTIVVAARSALIQIERNRPAHQ